MYFDFFCFFKKKINQKMFGVYSLVVSPKLITATNNRSFGTTCWYCVICRPTSESAHLKYHQII